MNFKAEAGESGEPLINRLRLRLISEIGFNKLKNPIMLIGLVLPRLGNSVLIPGLVDTQSTERSLNSHREQTLNHASLLPLLINLSSDTYIFIHMKVIHHNLAQHVHFSQFTSKILFQEMYINTK